MVGILPARRSQNRLKTKKYDCRILQKKKKREITVVMKHIFTYEVATLKWQVVGIASGSCSKRDSS